MTPQTPALVPASNIVAEVIDTSAKLIGAGKIAKETGSTIAVVRANHIMQQAGAAGLVLAAHATGKGHKAAIAALASDVESQFRRAATEAGSDYALLAKALTGALSPFVALNYVSSVRADGRRIVKRDELRGLISRIFDLTTQTGKTGKPTPTAKTARAILSIAQSMAPDAMPPAIAAALSAPTATAEIPADTAPSEAAPL